MIIDCEFTWNLQPDLFLSCEKLFPNPCALIDVKVIISLKVKPKEILQ